MYDKRAWVTKKLEDGIHCVKANNMHLKHSFVNKHQILKVILDNTEENPEHKDE